MRILYCHSTLVPPPKDPNVDRFFLLSRALEGDVLQPIWFRKPEEVESEFGPGSYPVYTVGRFRYHWFLTERYRGFRRKLAIWRFYISRGRQIHRERPFDCIVAYSHMTTAICGAILKALTHTKLIAEIATVPELAYLSEKATSGWRDRLMHFYSDFCLRVTLMASDRVHLLYPSQLDGYGGGGEQPASVFHEFVPVSAVPRHREGGDQYLLLAGAPWRLKGADLLVAAFQRLAPDFPNVKLKLLGYLPESEAAEAAKHPQIETLKARPNAEALQVISGACIFALPSRCEGMGRVILEAMAAGVPVIASNVGGIPRLVRSGLTGYLIPSEDARALEMRIRELLNDPNLRSVMGRAGYEIAHAEFSEEVYVSRFVQMIEDAVRPVSRQ
jgi:glycosyltransferase involved in cell wall biosynthesis